MATATVGRRAALRPTWYAGPDTRWGELWTMLHLPYTGMVLSFVVVGALLAPSIDPRILAASLAAYFLGLGLGSHFLDQLPGMGSRYVRHWSTTSLAVVGAAGIAGAVAIGVVGAAVAFGPVFLAFVAAQAIVAIGYPLAPVFRGALHGNLVFAISWGAVPLLTSYFAEARTITGLALLASIAAGAVAYVEIRLSRRARSARREVRSEPRANGPARPTVRALERSLQWLVVASLGAVPAIALVRWVLER